MIDWQTLVVWPWLLAGAAICSVWNWRAGVAFASCVLLVKLIQQMQHESEQIMFFGIYSVIGVLVFFKWDKHAGVVLCLVGMVYIPYMAGFIMQFPKIVLIEVLLFLGMAVCAYNGPSGGILARPVNSNGARYRHNGAWCAASAGKIVARSERDSSP